MKTMMEEEREEGGEKVKRDGKKKENNLGCISKGSLN